MSDTGFVMLDKVTLEDFIAVESGSEKISVKFFKARHPIGSDGWSSEMLLSADQADELIALLKKHVNTVRTF